MGLVWVFYPPKCKKMLSMGAFYDLLWMVLMEKGALRVKMTLKVTVFVKLGG